MGNLMVLLFTIFCLSYFTVCHGRIQEDYKPTWESLDSRPLPEWYDDVKFGIFLHWGVYSVPSFGSEWFWLNWKSGSPLYVLYMAKNYAPGFTYQNFEPDFKAEFFNPTEWADIFESSGAKYVVLTSKHHEGFTLWPSSRSFSWNSVDVGPHRDLVGELSKAITNKEGMHFGVYYSLYEWYNPMYLNDKNANFNEQTYVYEKMWPEVTELINKYKPEVLWTDGDWEATDNYWRSKEFLAWLFNKSPVKDTIIVNDRWGSGIPCNHGGIYTCTDRFNPGVLQKHKWENCMTVDKQSWGYRRNAHLSDYLSIEELIKELVSTVSCGGNLLMNVGPTKDGTLAPIFQERLKQMGQWMSVNGEAIYKTRPWQYQNDTVNGNVWYTMSKDGSNKTNNEIKQNIESAVYAIVLEWPKGESLNLGALAKKMNKEKSKIVMLGQGENPLVWTENDQEVKIQFPNKSTVKSQWSWALKITNLQ